MSDAAQTPAPSGFSASAKRVADWTVKGLLSVAVLIVGVGFGRQVLYFWQADDAAPIRLPSPGMLGDPERIHSIRFGDAAWSLNRRSISGNRDEAIIQLRADCRQVLQSIKPRPSVAPGDHDGVAVQLPPQQSVEPPPQLGGATDYKDGVAVELPPQQSVEPPPQLGGATDGRGFMEYLADTTPVDREPGKWRLYEFAETFPMAVGIVDSDADLAQSRNRAIIWAIAVPADENQWSLCIFHPADSSARETASPVDAPLPPDCRRTLSIETLDGGAIVAFTGPGEPDNWKRSYDKWFAERNWRQTITWRPIGKAWYAKYVSPDPVDCAAEVRFGPDTRGGMSGLLMITPLRPK